MAGTAVGVGAGPLGWVFGVEARGGVSLVYADRKIAKVMFVHRTPTKPQRGLVYGSETRRECFGVNGGAEHTGSEGP